MKLESLQKRASKFSPKFVYVIDSGIERPERDYGGFIWKTQQAEKGEREEEVEPCSTNERLKISQGQSYKEYAPICMCSVVSWTIKSVHAGQGM
jgi:hypothetical protein